ncbi:MAG TPA: tetratricopeptide repeat protein [Planctomycetota bacterium]
MPTGTARTSAAGASLLEGREVVVLGRLRACSLAEAHARVAAAGGRLGERIGARTAWVVLADDGVPLGDDGALPGALEEARARVERGEPLEFLGEAEFLQRLGPADGGASLRRLYTSAQLARILDVSPRRIAAWVRAGLIRPARTARRLAHFEFRAVAQARALVRLTARGATPRRIRASLEALERWWPDARASLAQLDVLEGRPELCVRTPSGALAEASGQLRFDFASAGAEPAEPVGAEELWFQRGLRLEQEERLDEATQAYARALDPAHPRPEIAFNLGNALYALERREEACAAFGLATELDPEYVEAWNNLGNALSLLGRHAEARAALERALALEPGYADAHFNLAETLAAAGELEPARAHWRAYLEHDPDSRWAAEVRARLRRTDRGRPRALVPESETPSGRAERPEGAGSGSRPG